MRASQTTTGGGQLWARNLREVAGRNEACEGKPIEDTRLKTEGSVG